MFDDFSPFSMKKISVNNYYEYLKKCHFGNQNVHNVLNVKSPSGYVCKKKDKEWHNIFFEIPAILSCKCWKPEHQGKHT